MKSAKALVDLMAFFTVVFQSVLKAVEGFGTLHDARSLEAFTEAQVKALGTLLFETCWRLRAQEVAPPQSLPCRCGRRLHRRGRRERTVRGVLGEINLAERYYFHCDACGATRFWGDELRGRTDFTPLAEERIALAGKDGAYAQAAATLARLGLFAVAASTVREVCLRVGSFLRARRDREAAEQYGVDAVPVEERPRRLAIGADGTMLGRVDAQHRRRKSARHGPVAGKTRLRNFFQEVKTLVVFEFDQAGEALRKSYFATQARVEAFREHVALEAHRRSAQTAEVLVFLGDGAAWIWKTAEELFPRAIQVLDWYHALEHLWAVGRAGFGSQSRELVAWVKAREAELWAGRVEAVLKALREVSRRLGRPDERLSEEARERDARWIAHRNVGYFETNASRMRYPEYRARGLPIGSGVVEAACKHVVGTRMKRPGMRWDEEGAESLLALRCEDLSGRWDELWGQKAAG